MNGYGLCEVCWRVVWVARILGRDAKGEPYGFCSRHDPLRGEAPPPPPRGLSVVPDPSP